MIDLAELISRTRTRFDHASATRWTDEAVTLSLNEGLETLAEATGFYERYSALPIQNNRIWYDLRGFTPETPVSVKAVWSTVRNQWLYPTTEDQLMYRWKSSTGDPEQFFTRGIYWLGIWPRPTVAANTDGYLRVYFTGVPARRQHTQEVLSDLPDNYAPALIDYALYDMSSKDREYSKAIRHYQSYMAREKALKNRMDDRLTASTAGVIGGLAGWDQ